MPEKIENINEKLERELVTLVTPEGEEVEAEVLIFFGLDSTQKKYLVYTYNEKDKNNMITVYASTYIEEGDKFYLDAIATDAEWEQVKEVMRQTIKSGGNE